MLVTVTTGAARAIWPARIAERRTLLCIMIFSNRICCGCVVKRLCLRALVEYVFLNKGSRGKDVHP